MQNLLILGAGQYGMVAKEIAESMRKYDHIDFLDDNNPIAVGKLGDFENLSNVYDSAVVAIGNSDFRLKLIEELRKVGYNIPCLIHERAYVSPSAKIGMGSFIEPMVVVHTEVTIETGCIISAGVIINKCHCFAYSEGLVTATIQSTGFAAVKADSGGKGFYFAAACWLWLLSVFSQIIA